MCATPDAVPPPGGSPRGRRFKPGVIGVDQSDLFQVADHGLNHGLTASDITRLQESVDSIPEFQQMGIIYFNQAGSADLIRESAGLNGLRSYVVLREKAAEPADPYLTSDSAALAVASSEDESDMGSELLNMGLSCGSAVLAGIAGTGSAGATFISAGISTPLTVILWSGALASAAQCGISGGRVINEIVDPNRNDHLDSKEWYQYASGILDGISIVGGGASIGQALRSVLQLTRTSGKPIMEILKGLNRAQRKQLAMELARYQGQASTRKQFLRLARTGKIPKVLRNHEIQEALRNELLSSISSSLTFSGSATGGLFREVYVYLVVEDA